MYKMNVWPWRRGFSHPPAHGAGVTGPGVYGVFCLMSLAGRDVLLQVKGVWRRLPSVGWNKYGRMKVPTVEKTHCSTSELEAAKR
jgi:hypothetical protein